ncbi:MAG: TonB-dependent receptor [Rhodanobacteraceae bacterium]
MFVVALLAPLCAIAQEQVPQSLPQIDVYGMRRDETPAKLEHQMPEVDGTRITVTKKTTVTKLDHVPTIIDNNVQQLFVRSPGLLVSEQSSPTQFNLSYRGLGNPQESEYVLVLQDGIPIESDWIGFPTLNYLPQLQEIREIELIRGGASLLYGPQPAPAINFVSRRPTTEKPFAGYSENIIGNHGLFGSYNEIEGSEGKFEYRVAGYYRSSDGERVNANGQVRGVDAYLGYSPDSTQHWGLDLHANTADAGDAGRIGFPQYQRDPHLTNTPYNRTWVQRYTLVLSHEREFADNWLLEGKLWSGYQDLAQRSANGFVPPQPPPSTTTLQDEQFRYTGADVRLRHKWGRGNAFTIGTTLYHADAPFRQWTNPDLAVARTDHSGTPRLNQARGPDYASVFAENVFRLPHRIHIVPSVRLDHEKISINEAIKPPFLTRPLIDETVTRSEPLFGIGIGNDFGHQNETYFNVSQGWRPVRYFDVASPFSNLQPGNVADPSKSLSYELGAHGTPVTGLYYDASLFWIDFRNRIETEHINATDVINVNTGNTRHRGFEGDLSYDFLARAGNGEHLEAFASVQLLNARFTGSIIPNQIGKTPAFAPRYLFKGGITWRADKRYKIALTATSVASQYWQDSDAPRIAGDASLPAKIPAYTVFDLAGDWQIAPKLRLLGGISNLGDRRYYDRVFTTGLEPAPGRTIYGGASVNF